MSSLTSNSNFVLRMLYLAIATLLALGLLIPPELTTAWLNQFGPERRESVLIGVWILKLMSLLNAGLLLGLIHPRVQNCLKNQSLLQSDCSRNPVALSVWVLLTGTLLVAAAARFYGLNDGLWYDEIRTLIWYARQPFIGVLSTFDSQNQHMLYSLSAQAAIGIFGESAWSLRLPAAIFGVASLAATFWFGRQVTNNREALLATMLLAFSYHHVWFSQNARGYSGLLLWTLIGSVLWLRLLRGETNRSGLTILGYAATIALGVYTHATAVFVPAAHALMWGVLAWQKRRDVSGLDLWAPMLAIVFAASFTLQLYAVVLPQFLDTILNPVGSALEYEWQSPLWLIGEMVQGLSRGIPGGLFSVAAGGCLFALGLISYIRQSRSVAAAMVLPALLLILMLIVLGHNLWPRMFLFSAGFGALLVVRGIDVTCGVIACRWRIPAATATASLLILASASTVPRAWGAKQDYAGAKDVVVRLADARDAVVTVDMTTMPFQKFLELDWVEVNTVTELRRIEETHRHTFVLYTFPTRLASAQPEIWKRLEKEYRIVDTRHGSISGGAIVIKQRE